MTSLLPSTPEEGQEILEEISADQHRMLQDRFKTDLYFAAKWGLGYNELDPNAHAALCAFMVHEQANRRMVLMPRGFLKSTICTIADSIRLSCINPNIRILLQNEVLGNAAGFLTEIKNHWTANDTLRWLFPDLVPPKVVGPGSDWSQEKASLNRTTVSRVSTYTASGSGGSPQSQHFEVIKNDDLIGEKAKNSETEMKKAIEWADAQTPLLNRLEDQIDFYGTRKTMADVYQHVMERTPSMKVFIRLPIEGGQAIFHKVPMEQLIRIQTETPDLWAYDYMNNPTGKGGLDWGKGLLRTYHLSSDRERIVLEDHITGLLVWWSLRECDIVITADPNSGKADAPDKGAVIAHAITPRQQIVVLESWSDRVSPDGLVNQIFEMAMRWKPRIVGIEDEGVANTLYYFEKKCAAERWFFSTQRLLTRGVEKSLRIRTALDTPLKARRVYVQANMVTLISQIQLHPQLATHNWDEIDTLAAGPQVYQAGMTTKDLKDEEEAVEKFMAHRGITGYGRSV